jgi:hypothetical protein
VEGGGGECVGGDIISVKDGVHHRADRVLSFFSSRPNWDTPIPSPAGECVPPFFGSGGRTHSLGREEVGSIVRKTPDTALCSILYSIQYVSTLWGALCFVFVYTPHNVHT